MTSLPAADIAPDTVDYPVRGRVVPFLGRHALIDNKCASARLEDLAGVEALGEPPVPLD